MNPTYDRSALLAIWIILYSLFMDGLNSSAQAKDGVDVVMLIDVSRSMYRRIDNISEKEVYGNDTERLRWGAAQLVLNLLYAEDRILILPFNHTCPATYTDETTKPLKTVPGVLPYGRELTLLSRDDGQFRDALGQKVQSFVHQESQRQTNDPLEFNGDAGTTNLLHALGVAGERLLASPVIGQRKQIVIVLTDGEQNSDEAGEQESMTMRW